MNGCFHSWTRRDCCIRALRLWKCIEHQKHQRTSQRRQAIVKPWRTLKKAGLRIMIRWRVFSRKWMSSDEVFVSNRFKKDFKRAKSVGLIWSSSWKPWVFLRKMELCHLNTILISFRPIMKANGNAILNQIGWWFGSRMIQSWLYFSCKQARMPMCLSNGEAILSLSHLKREDVALAGTVGVAWACLFHEKFHHDEKNIWLSPAQSYINLWFLMIIESIEFWNYRRKAWKTIFKIVYNLLR